MLEDMEPVLKVENLVKNYYKPGTRKREIIKAVQGVSFSVYPGQIFGLIGSSGSGKTTILKMIFNIEKPDEGQIYINNESLTSGSLSKRRQLLREMGLVLQDPYSSLCPRYKVRDILAEPLIIHGIVNKISRAESDIKEMLSTMELEPEKYLYRYPHQLSGGERQRIALARALMLKPFFLALDEPTSMLDTTTKRGIIDLIKKLTRKKMGVLLVTHDLAMASHICDYVVVLKDGRIIEEGETERVIQSPKKAYTRNLLLAATDLEKYWKTL